MRLDNTILQDLISVLSEYQDLNIALKISLTLHIDDMDIVPYNIFLIGIQRDFIGESFDAVELDCTLPTGTFSSIIYDNRDILEATLVIDYVPMRSGAKLDKDIFPTIARRYRVMLPVSDNHEFSASTYHDIVPEQGDLDGMREVRLILTDPNKDQILHSTTGTIVRRSTTADALRGIMTVMFNQMGLSEENGMLGVNLAPGYSEEQQEAIVIPQLKELLDLPRYMQEEEYGVYSGGISCYMQNNTCYIFPPFDTDQVKKGARTVTILNLPKDMFPGAESTWAQLDDEFFIAATSVARATDSSEAQQLSLGTGVQYANADNLMRVGGVATDGRLFINGADNTVKTSITSRRDEFNFLTPGTRSITSNHLHENSQLQMRNGMPAAIIWDNAKLDVIHPGMAVRVLTVVGLHVKEYHGVIHGVNHSIAPTTANPMDPFFASTARIDMFLTYDPIDEYDLTGEG